MRYFLFSTSFKFLMLNSLQISKFILHWIKSACTLDVMHSHSCSLICFFFFLCVVVSLILCSQNNRPSDIIALWISTDTEALLVSSKVVFVSHFAKGKKGKFIFNTFIRSSTFLTSIKI